MSASPAVGRALDILLLLAGKPGPVSAAVLARELDLPRSSVYHILTVLQDRGFVVHLPEHQGYGLGVTAFEIGSAYLRHAPLERLAQPILHRLAIQLGQAVHLGVLHGNETLYLLKERPSSGPAAEVSLITDVGVRLPAHLTANGRAILAALPDAQVAALYTRSSTLVSRTGRGPRTLAELRRLLGETRERGWADEVEDVTVGLRSVGAAVFDHSGHPVAALSTTWRRHLALPEPGTVGQVLRDGAARLTARISGRAPE
ncbi:IclR family transcriptional regulator [Tsukamurella ocularis]|uniref:IclR family transcriptional regulator n=1 Tax=Tsukamurella ocularis TaxID=1970234 RepID=UPI002169610D|nr:IclR family transcriptional regulator [Tsukamurella ocularis]MCS3781884.1 DNA-binding IclR family transcriptional regulator [Tsukamurella ocularis]MCS3788378.1 DNA-binding IclR family transcriptional regulator [Tsukamurella ocularis]MCS3852098.1 DNA-binding IclR family transcriptional regulator [Tsukamurella ocularis]